MITRHRSTAARHHGTAMPTAPLPGATPSSLRSDRGPGGHWNSYGSLMVKMVV